MANGKRLEKFVLMIYSPDAHYYVAGGGICRSINQALLFDSEQAVRDKVSNLSFDADKIAVRRLQLIEWNDEKVLVRS